jgi:cold shock CspA family protein
MKPYFVSLLNHRRQESTNVSRMNQPKRERDRVRWFKIDKGYGRITSDEFNDILFVHFSSIIQEGGFRALREGQLVEYTRSLGPGPRGSRAVATEVVVVS